MIVEVQGCRGDPAAVRGEQTPQRREELGGIRGHALREAHFKEFVEYGRRTMECANPNMPARQQVSGGVA